MSFEIFTDGTFPKFFLVRARLCASALINQMSTYDDQKDKINPVPEGMSVLHVVHYVRPSLQTYYLHKQRNAVKSENETRAPLGGGSYASGSAQIIAFNLGCREDPSLAWSALIKGKQPREQESAGEREKKNVVLTYEEYGHPGKANIVERYRALEWIVAVAFAFRVIVVPVDTRVVADKRGVIVRQCCMIALHIPCIKRLLSVERLSLIFFFVRSKFILAKLPVI